MKTLVAYPVVVDLADIDDLIYLPSLAMQPKDEFVKAIALHKPDCVVVGNNSVDAELLESWRNLKGKAPSLDLVRRGTSILRIDTEMAKELGINIINTPGVNSPFVAEYIFDNLNLEQTSGKKLAVIGSGGIGARVARKAAEFGLEVIVYSPSLADSTNQAQMAAKKELLHPKISFAASAEEAVIGASHVAIAVDAEKITSPNLQISEDFVSALNKDARVVSVSELKVFSPQALRLLRWRIEDEAVTALFDSNPADVKALNTMTLPENFKSASKAMKGNGCQEAMDQAMLTVLADISLKHLLQSGVNFAFDQPAHRRNTAITVVGAGISGKMTAYALNRQGYQVTVIDSHDKPDYENRFFYQGSTTIDGADARHASVTETVPHATPLRAGILGKTPLEGGWEILDEMDPGETEWAKRFGEVAAYPELQSIFTRFVAQLNRTGIKLWEDFFKSMPEISQSTVSSTRIVRLYTSEQAWQDGLHYQKKLHNIDDEIVKITKNELAKLFPSLDITHIAGGVEVSGYTVNLHKLTKLLQDFLETQGVEFRWSARIKSLDRSKVILEDDEVINSEHIILSTGVTGSQLLKDSIVNNQIQGVTGYWLELPNVNKIKEGIKIHEADPIGVINVTISADNEKLLFSGAFGFTGKKDLREFRSNNLDNLNIIFRRAIGRYFPTEYIAGSKAGKLEAKFCVRPMTPDGMPVVGELGSSKILFSGGTNAGGFTQSPILSLIIGGCAQADTRYQLLAKALSPLRETLKITA